MKIAYPHFVLADSLTQVPLQSSSQWVRAATQAWLGMVRYLNKMEDRPHTVNAC
jgi:hypothetical protein